MPKISSLLVVSFLLQKLQSILLLLQLLALSLSHDEVLKRSDSLSFQLSEAHDLLLTSSEEVIEKDELIKRLKNDAGENELVK